MEEVMKEDKARESTVKRMTDAPNTGCSDNKQPSLDRTLELYDYKIRWDLNGEIENWWEFCSLHDPAKFRCTYFVVD